MTFVVNGQLLVEGTESDSVLFTTADDVEEWKGIDLHYTTDVSEFHYIEIEDANRPLDIYFAQDINISNSHIILFLMIKQFT